MFASPITGRCFVFCGLAVVPRPEVCPSFRVLVFREVAVITMSIRHLFDLVTLFTQHDKFFLRPLRRTFRLVEASKGLAVVLDTARREPLEAFGCHGDKLPEPDKTVNGGAFRRKSGKKTFLLGL